MKNFNEKIIWENSFPNALKLLRVMKLTVFLTLISVFCIFAGESYSQTKKLTLKMENAKVEDVLATIEKQSEFYFFIYSEKVIDVERKVSIDIKNENIETVLNTVFEGTNVAYSIDNRLIILSTPELITNKAQAIWQQATVSGKVTDASGQPLPGVSIVIEGTMQGTVTNADGEYTLTDLSPEATLVFSFVGMRTQEIVVGNQTTINVTMEEKVTELEEVVAVGYGTRQRGKITGSISDIGGEKIKQSGETNIMRSLQGKIPGMTIVDRGGEPGYDDISFNIRGGHTLGDNSFLIVIDGVPHKSFSNLSPDDIESISVLKDASAAIYGARAANGVIVIRTKRGKAGKPSIKLESNYIMSSFTRVINMMNSYQIATWINETEERYGRVKTFTDEDLQRYKSGDYPLTHPNIDWHEVVYKDWTPKTHHNLSTSGGSDNIQYFLSGDYIHQEGQFKSGDTYYNQYQIRSNVDVQPWEYLNVAFDLSARLEDVHRSTQSTHMGYVYSMVDRSAPFFIDRYPNGLYGGDLEAGQNPLITTSDKAGWDESQKKLFNFKLSFDLNMDWLTEGLSIKGYGSVIYDINNSETFHNTWTVYSYNSNTEEYTPVDGYNQHTGNMRDLKKENIVSHENLYHIRLNYNRSFGGHNLNGFVAYEQMEGLEEVLSAYRKNLPSDTKVQLFTGSSQGLSNDGIAFSDGRVNYFGSVNYDYRRKYILDFSLRYDGSFNFPKEGRFGLFSGVSLGWAISEESFMAPTNNWLDNLKIRASWGKMGNDRVPSFEYMAKYDLLGYNSRANWPSGRATWFFGGNLHKGLILTNVPNPNITWEISDMKNIGFDAILWDEKLSINFDYFYEKRSRILIERTELVPDYTGLELPHENLGKVDNSGIEINLNHKNKIGSVHYNVGGNFSYNQNKIVFMDEAKDVPEYRKKEGHPIDSYVVYKTDGIFNTQEELENTEATLPGTKPGDIKYVDINGDGSITGDDMIRSYASPIPKIQYGINGGINYKGYELNVLFTGQAKAQVDMRYANIRSSAPAHLFEKRWTSDNKNAEYPRAFERNDFYNCQQSDFWLYDVFFMRLKSAELAYNLPSKWISGINFNNIRLYLNGFNLWTFFDHLPNNVDPELGNTKGVYYPQQTIITAGVNINL